jgi:hypothetical protein
VAFLGATFGSLIQCANNLLRVYRVECERQPAGGWGGILFRATQGIRAAFDLRSKVSLSEHHWIVASAPGLELTGRNLIDHFYQMLFNVV